MAGACGIVFTAGLFGLPRLIGKPGDGRSPKLFNEASAQSTGSWNLGPNTATLAVHASLLPDGKIFYFAGSGYHQSFEHGPYEARVRENVDTGADTKVTMLEDLWCGGHTHLANGNLLLAGGTLQYDLPSPPNCNGKWHGLDAVYEFDVLTRKLIERPSMAHGRWYPSCVTLPDGKVFTYTGIDEYGANNRLPEVYDPATLSWSIKYDPLTSYTYCAGQGETCPGAGSPCYGSNGKGVGPFIPGYGRMHLMPSGLVASTGFAQTVRTWHPSTGEWKFAANTAMFRHYGCSILLPLNNTTNERGTVMLVGGSTTSAANATPVVEVIDFNAGTNLTPVIRTVQSLQYARKFAESVILPTGNILIMGGCVYNTTTNYRLVPEMFDPVTETWTSLPAMTVQRSYHMVALLLPDGRVWVGGSTAGRGKWELRTEIFRPSYYFENRPTISGNPTVGDYGTRITLPTPDAASVTKVSLVRLESKTHHYDPNQRFLWLQINKKTSSTVEVLAPLNAKLAPPGYYMIHILDSSGVPSVANIIKIPGIGSGTGATTGAVVFYDVPYPGNSSSGLGSSTFRVGEQAYGSASQLIGKSLKEWTVYLKQTGSASGNVTAVVRRNSGDAIVATFNPIINASTLPTTAFAPTLFTLTSPYTIQYGDRIMIEYTGPGSVDISIWTTDKFDGGNTRRTTYKTSYSSGSGSDVVGKMSTGSGSDTTPPSGVTGLTATSSGSSQIDLAWNANTEPDFDHYNVYRGISPNFPVNTANDPPIATATTNSYSDTGLLVSTTYYYKVAAVDDAGNRGAASDEASAETGSLEVIYAVPSPGNGVASLLGGGANNTRYGVEAVAGSVLVGKSLKKWVVYLRRYGSPSGNVNARIRRAAGDAVAATFTETINSSILPTTLSPITFTLPTPYTIQTGDRVLVEYSGSSRIEIELWTSDKFDGNNTRRTRYSGTSYASANHDITGTMSTG